ncbi:MAG: ATP-binding cassette domain-containing protein, partial [Planctomycetota bacterium]|nr:ATP-binding cassette domain-containing protein [Planctomycetota bacterium]
MITVDALSKIYSDTSRGDLLAVDGVSFSVQPGEIFGLLGANGAGKTTVLRILSTVLKPTSGTAIVAGHSVLDAAGRVRQKIGFVSNNTAIYDRMSALEMVQHFGKLHGLSTEEVRARTELLFRQLRMEDFRDVLGAKMSTGMQQKVSIARALIHDPPVLIFDEAT